MRAPLALALPLRAPLAYNRAPGAIREPQPRSLQLPTGPVHDFALFGIIICEASSGSWYVETGAFNTPLGKGIALLAGCCIAIVLSVASRAPKEDELLSDMFGQEWKTWAQRVSYRFIPGVL